MPVIKVLSLQGIGCLPYNERISFELQKIHDINEIEISVSLHYDSLYMYVFHWSSSGQLEARYPNAYSLLATHIARLLGLSVILCLVQSIIIFFVSNSLSDTTIP